MITRLRVYTLLFIVFFIVLLIRLFYWQIYNGSNLSAEARTQYKQGRSLSAQRGEILASDGSWLVASGQSWLIYASIPNLKNDPKKIAEKLAPILIESEDRKDILEEIDRITSLLQKKDIVWISLKSRISDDIKNKIDELKIEGIGFEPVESRIYPEGSSSAQILGFVGKDDEGNDKGYFGIEGFYDLPLSGKPGFISRDADASGIPIILGSSREVSAIKGVNLSTHIDKSVQFSIEKKLKKGIEQYGAVSGTVIVMDPKQGSILGMSSIPSYDPSRYWEYGDTFFNNPAIFSSFEPGSIFKVLIMAAGIDAGVIKPETICDVCSGPYRIDKYSIETWNNQYHPNSTMVDVIVNSDNVGMTFVGEKLGPQMMFEYLTKFKIGEPTGIDLQGEISPKLREKDSWSIVDVATASFGQGIAVTPIQMIRAVAAIANGGVIRRPQVVEKIVGDGWEDVINNDSAERVISEKAANEVTLMMAEAASRGESKWTYKKGFRVAGKTGTAQIPIAGHYDEEKTNASFIGFAPYNDPKFVMLVTLQEPSTSPWASETAAPLWYSIAGDLFTYFGIQPEN
ncbi:hypothetical protein A2962_05015 [Candidatus Woesebacteria bacterium RIFCSPLOWO2_01_FULL_39_61]|uniref:Penicillin-binding protein transpeptidase domain-containing protein n=1 Tax=Candidatus Woesebacteria bacterium RIFCSPHIGHO2_02_FULL_39_13 TaxID=1802505 RepID=A0A1F7Z0K4_9BACT|nr:MAG: hypothetical protein A2692_03265 [Candidatus Woesebacteria bacterium RIFCSPHIGHO2_01_FULL_39_95]OGM32629.1 MAG: hypothetical protein A3D01_05240 [Candidatus Woesebacteria bacterium RIFCSPHIGHO2_02_FULL_39_13]OGM36426.1 MAG: hypothetical protein A3E13_00785 [Candidatus Woesebacteria bacterium RIFCSPHIGHO2_12_FULL_40_20]OGM66697.1 MAG: hypothetical protein A2962_05015 [Candidatus Woesebacteria bacterium RIFCSPLOWO2_01_FULL_39_61]OGM73031.1 MAG: hypothetical protein A3H19_03150 [Candidatus